MNDHNPPLPKERMKVRYPGKIVYAAPSGQSFHGCAVAEFRTSEEMNEFFRDNPGYLLVDLKTAKQPLIGGDQFIYVCIYTSALEDEDLELLKDHGQAIEKVREEITKERLELAAKQHEEAAKQQAETNRLVSVGVKCEADHKGIEMERHLNAQFRKRVKANVSKEQWLKFNPKMKVTDEVCQCGALRSEHGDTIGGLAKGHGGSERTSCAKFTWKENVIEEVPE